MKKGCAERSEAVEVAQQCESMHLMIGDVWSLHSYLEKTFAWPRHSRLLPMTFVACSFEIGKCDPLPHSGQEACPA